MIMITIMNQKRPFPLRRIRSAESKRHSAVDHEEFIEIIVAETRLMAYSLNRCSLGSPMGRQ